MTTKLLSLYGLKFHPFRPDVPTDALFTTPAVDSYLRRVELGIADGGFAMLTGDPGTGKSVALRLLAERLRALPDVVVGTVEHPQSRTMDFYRELGDLFGVPLAAHNRWAGFKALRARWADHVASTRCRPVLIVDEAQETLTTVFSELRILASKDLDSKQLLCVVFAGDAYLSATPYPDARRAVAEYPSRPPHRRAGRPRWDVRQGSGERRGWARRASGPRRMHARCSRCRRRAARASTRSGGGWGSCRSVCSGGVAG
jgi:type II secretory pathway predicted ATPase ExeA